jgi:hypothetical protein
MTVYPRSARSESTDVTALATEGVRLLPCARMTRALGGLALLAVVSVGALATAAQYPGWGDTGWVHASRRECCNSAIAIANDYSAQACLSSGGVPRPFRGVQRGTCQVQWDQDAAGRMLYRCFGEAATWCS